MALLRRKRLMLEMLIILATAGIVLIAGLVSPKQNWDMVAYVAAAYQDDGHSGDDLRLRTYGDVAAAVDQAAFRQLTSGPYRGVVAGDSVALEQQLPFYTIRVAYIALVRAVGKVTGSYAHAAHIVPAGFGFLAVLAMGWILLRIGVTAAVLPLLISPLGILGASRMGTPDSMACFASLLLVIAMLGRSTWAYVLIAVLPAIRSDYVIFATLAAAILFLRGDRLRAGVAAAVGILLYLLLGRISGNYGYLNLLNFTLFGQQPYPAQLPIATDIGAYARAIATGVNYMISDGLFVVYTLALVLIWRSRRALRDDLPLLVLVALPVAFATIHFALFPSYDNRFLVSSFFLVTAGLLRQLSLTDWPAARPGGAGAEARAA